MNDESKHSRLFWLIFAPLFIASSFIPVLPLYIGAGGDVLMWVVPIWAIYAALFAMPEWFLFSCPVIVTHASACYLIARRIADTRENMIQFSLFSLFSASSILSICISLIVAYGDIGFCIFFLACLMTITIANFLQWKSIVGLPVPKMNQTILIASAILCGIMFLFGFPIAVAQIAG